MILLDSQNSYASYLPQNSSIIIDKTQIQSHFINYN